MDLKTRLGMGAAALVAACGTALGGSDEDETLTFNYQGYLEQEGDPYGDGTASVSFRVFTASSEGIQVGATEGGEIATDVDPQTGYFSTEVTLEAVESDSAGDVVPIFDGRERWLEVVVNGEPLSPRKKVNPAPVASDVVYDAKVWDNEGVNSYLAQGFNVGIGTTNPMDELHVNGTARANEVTAQEVRTDFASTGILEIRGGSDIAEPFDVAGAARPGMLVSIDPERVGEMRVSSGAYDSRVAGVISGAGGVNPGLTLTQEGTEADGEQPVALSGRVWCYVDAGANGAVEAGDLLTSSPTPGHAMRATDERRSHGAVIGKAMSSLEEGRGLVLVLVNLQ